MGLVGGTLAVDIGGTGIKALVLDPTGEPLNERVRLDTPRPATPDAVIDAILRLAAQCPQYERVSIGFPGVVDGGVIFTAANLDGDWTKLPLAREIELRTERMTRVCNDADMQGLAVVEGKGVEMVLTLGTGMGSALFVDGKLVPNLELAHHPFRKKLTYEEYVGRGALKHVGEKRWARRVLKVLEQIQPIWNPRLIFLGGGNAKKLEGDEDLPKNVRIVANVNGLLGGIRLWDDLLT
jgi:polyphosphate glucokinase